MRSNAAPTVAVATLPGPVDRVHFLDEQRRNRRASWRFSLFAAVAAVLSGLPLSILLSPVLFGLIVLVVHLVNLFVAIPAGVWSSLEQVARAVPNTWTVMRGGGGTVPWALLASALVLPGSIVMLLAWVWIRALFHHVGVGGILRRLEARPPQRDVVEELQIVNIVEEMAIAAGLPPLRVMLIDSSAANAAAVGLTTDDATILVSGGLLELDRDARQAILAHVIGSVGNGDLKIASVILTVFQVWGLLALVIDTAFGPRSRIAVRQFLATSRRAWRVPADRMSAARMLDRLMDGAGMTFDDLFEHTDAAETSRPLPLALFVDVPLYLTFGVGAIASKAAIALFTLLVFGPWVARLWRSRRRLADATAVQLTRNPDALAHAVREMENRNVEVEGGAAVSFLFPFWTRWTPDAPPRDDIMEHIVGTQLELERRLASLRALGATFTGGVVAIADESPQWKQQVAFIGWGVLALLLITACVAFNLLTTSLLLWGVWAVLHYVLGGGPGA
ncbi:MAG TPA: hypothetical protein VJM31_17410 [Vicinamibacterales bacterium]|nr:hypothetical protein [Vicinamibacterales bacterium]